MVAVLNSPHFNNDFPLGSTITNNRDAVHDEIADKVIGAAPGATATVSRTRIKGSTTTGKDNSAKVDLENVTLFSRATTSADVAALKEEVIRKPTSLAFPRDLSGNGGPAFSRT
jgi:hypothetical protein